VPLCPPAVVLVIITFLFFLFFFFFLLVAVFAIVIMVTGSAAISGIVVIVFLLPILGLVIDAGRAGACDTGSGCTGTCVGTGTCVVECCAYVDRMTISSICARCRLPFHEIRHSSELLWDDQGSTAMSFTYALFVTVMVQVKAPRAQWSRSFSKHPSN
jgi:hypothetical protein